MTAREMDYHLRLKANKLDSQRRRTLKYQEINELLNISQETLVKAIASPRFKENADKLLGFEATQRNREDIRNIVVDEKRIGINKLGNNYVVELPSDYLFHEGSYVVCSDCPKKRLRTFVVQKDDLHEENPFEKSDLLWGEVNIEFIENNRVKIYADFTLNDFYISYVRRPRRILYVPEPYKGLNGEMITTSQDCELSSVIHEDIIDYACYLAAESVGSSNYQTKLEKLKQIGLI